MLMFQAEQNLYFKIKIKSKNDYSISINIMAAGMT